MQTTIIHATTFTSWRKRETPADQGLGRRKSAGVARCANQLVATVLYEDASRLARTVTRNGGSSPDCVSKPGSPSGSLITSERRVGSGAIGVCASPSRGRLTVQRSTRAGTTATQAVADRNRQVVLSEEASRLHERRFVCHLAGSRPHRSPASRPAPRL